MKILVVSNMYPDNTHPSYGIFVKRFCDQIQQIGIDFDLCVMLKKDSKVGKICAYLKFFVGAFGKIIFRRYDLIYVHYASLSSIPVLLASKFKRITVYTNVHGSDVVPENSKQENVQKYTRKILKKSERIIVPSEYFKMLCMEKYQLNKKEIIVYPSGGIDKKIFFPYFDKKVLYEKYGLEADKKYFGFCGRLTEKKDVTTFVKAVNVITKEHPKLRFIVVGDGPEKEHLHSLVKEFDLSKVITLFPLMNQYELSEIYNVLTAFVFPTRGESLGLVGIEAMACGVPVIASDCTAPKYYVADDENGYKFPVGDYEKLAKLILHVSDMGDKYQHLVNGALSCAQNYTSEIAISILRNVFNLDDYGVV